MTAREKLRLKQLSTPGRVEACVEDHLARALPDGWTLKRTDHADVSRRHVLGWLVFDPAAAPRGGTGNGDRSYSIYVHFAAKLLVIEHSNNTSGALGHHHAMRTASVVSFETIAWVPFELCELFAYVLRSTEPNFYWPT